MISVTGLTVRYGSTVAVDDLTLDLPADKIYGLLGRNGSGKTSLLGVLASYRRPSSGTVRIDGTDPYENATLMQQTAFIRDTLDVVVQDRVARVLELAARLRPSFDLAYARKLAEMFGLDQRKRVQSLSRGQKSSLGVVLGLASRAALTILDESYLGMDAVARDVFYRELLNDYLEHPRTIILSTHLIEEVADLFERVILIDRGRLVLHEDADELKARGVTVTGETSAVEAFVSGREVLDRRQLGGTTAATLYGRLGEDDRARAKAAGLTLGPVGLQELFVHLSTGESS